MGKGELKKKLAYYEQWHEELKEQKSEDYTILGMVKQNIDHYKYLLTLHLF